MRPSHAAFCRFACCTCCWCPWGEQRVPLRGWACCGLVRLPAAARETEGTLAQFNCGHSLIKAHAGTYPHAGTANNASSHLICPCVQAHVLEQVWPGLGGPGASTPAEKTGLLHIAQQHARTAALLLTAPGLLDGEAIDRLLRKASAGAVRRC